MLRVGEICGGAVSLGDPVFDISAVRVRHSRNAEFYEGAATGTAALFQYLSHDTDAELFKPGAGARIK
ncbi:MAG: hypothetical protein ACREEL_08350 [Stellaceae bacterium]